MESFNKFFENEEIVVETKEELSEEEVVVDDDTVYEIDLYNNLLGDLPIYMQNNPKIQEQYLKMTRHLIDLKNMAKSVDLDEVEDYADMKQIYRGKFNVSWVFPIVLDKKKIYRKLDINGDEGNDEVMEQYMEMASNKGMQYEDFLEELKKEVQYISEYQRDKLSYPTYRKLIYDIESPYIIKKELKKKEVGYQMYLENNAKLLRYFNIDNKFWKEYLGIGPQKFEYDQYDESGKRVGSKIAQVLAGDHINVIGFLVLGDNEENLLDVLEGEEWFGRIRMIGEATKIKKNDKAIVELKGHGLMNGDKVMIEGSNSEPSIDGDYDNIKVLNENEFILPVNTSEGKEGTFCKVYTETKLKFKKVELKGETDYSGEYGKDAVLYIFPEEDIKEVEWKQIVKRVMPRAGSIINSKMPLLEDASTVEEMDNILNDFSLEFRELGYDDYFTLSEILEGKYIEQKEMQSKFNYDKYYGEILALREKIIGDNKEKDVKNDMIFGNKYIFNEMIVKYYGNYPNVGTDVDSVASRYNWLLQSPDYGKLYFLILEREKIGDYKDGNLDLEGRIKEVRKMEQEVEQELKKIGNQKKCEDRKVSPVKIYGSFDELAKDVGKITEFKMGDYAIIESKKSHENGMIYEWNGMNWIQNPLIQSVDDLCLLGVEKIKNFDLEKLHCLFKEGCKNKKLVRLEKKLDKFRDELDILKDFTTDKMSELEKRLKEQIVLAELGLQIYLREKESTKKEEKIEIYEQDIDPLYLQIMKIPDLQHQEYLRNLLIKKDGILIDKDIYSIRTGKKICCGHYYYQLKIASGVSPEYSERIVQDMLAVYGTEERDGYIFCNHDGRPLMLMEYDTAEGLSKTTGEVSKQREVVKRDELELKEEIEADIVAEKQVDVFECSGAELRNELLKIGFDVGQVAKAKDICAKINTINSKTGILLKKSDFVGIIVDVIQLLQKLVDYNKFKQIEILKLKKQGIDLKKINPKIFQERYSNLMIIRKTTLIAARLLITYQTIIPSQFPTGRRTSVSFEGFDGKMGVEYLSMLIEEAKMMPIMRETKTGKSAVSYLPLGKIMEEIRKSYDDLSELSGIKKMKKERKIYDSRQVVVEEKRNAVRVREVPKAEKLPKGFGKEVDKLKKFKEFEDYQEMLYKRQAYLGQEVIKVINDVVRGSGDSERDDPKSLEMSCCFEPAEEGTSYYSYIREKVGNQVNEMLEELRENSFYYVFFLNGGMIMKHYPVRKKYMNISTNNLGVNQEKIRKGLFLTYVDSGIFKGEKHEFNEEGICLLTGESKRGILEKNYTEEQENNLIRAVIDKSVKQLVLGGSEKDIKDMEERDRELVDNIDLDKLKQETEKMMSKELSSFLDKMGKLLNKSGNKDYMMKLREHLETLGSYKRVMELERDKLETDPNVRSIEIVEFENYRNRLRISNLKRFINNYFRRYLSMVQNMYDPTEHIKRLEDMDEATSKELQKFMYERDYFMRKYLTKRDSEIFKKLRFDVSAKIISNITADTDKWDLSYSKIERIVNFNLSNLADSLMYILLRNLDRFISMEFEKGLDKNRLVAQFIMDILDMIIKDNDNLDYTQNTFIVGDYRTQEAKKGEEEVVKTDSMRMIDELSYKFKKVRGQQDYEEVYEELEDNDRKLAAKEKFLKTYKDKFDRDPTDNEIIDYMEELDKERELDADVDNEEYMMSRITQEGDDVLEIGDGYGEMPQGGEGGEEGDF